MAQNSNLIERIFWLIRLRWIAVAGVLLTISFTQRIFALSLAAFPLYVLTLLLALHNIVFFCIIKKKNSKSLSHANEIANIQISLDLVILTALIHFSGGIENFFIFYFIFHMIIASILLSRRASFGQATFAISLFTGMCVLEYSGFLRHYCLRGFIPYTLHNNPSYISGISFIFATTLYIAVYMASSISTKLREREKSLQEANILLREKDRIKSEYVLRVTHDIREDLSTVQSCIDPVTKGIAGSLNNEQKDLLTRAKERTGRLLTFVMALLEITRIKLMRQLKMEPFSLTQLAEGVCERIKARAESKNISFKVDIKPSIEIRGVRLYIEEAIANLLANSIKYTRPGGEVKLSITNNDDKVLVRVEDTGIGIPEDELPHVFEEFYRAKNAKQMEKDGTGLGLAIVKEIVDLHKGEIRIESEEGKGTTARIRLPKV